MAAVPHTRRAPGDLPGKRVPKAYAMRRRVATIKSRARSAVARQATKTPAKPQIAALRSHQVFNQQDAPAQDRGGIVAALMQSLSTYDTWAQPLYGLFRGQRAPVCPFDAPVAEKPSEDVASKGRGRTAKHKDSKRQQNSQKPRERNRRRSSSPPKSSSLLSFLNPLGYLETRYTRMMASLSAIAYRMDRLTPTYLRRMHGLELRYTSLACERVLGRPIGPTIDSYAYGDGMAASADIVEGCPASPAPNQPDTAAAAMAAASAFDHFYSSEGKSDGDGAGRRSGSSSSLDALTGGETPRGAASSNHIEGYTVWRPRIRVAPRRDAAAPQQQAARGTADVESLSDTEELQAACETAWLGADSCTPPWARGRWEGALGAEASVDDAAVPSSDEEERDGPDLRNIEGGMEGDIMHAAATSVLHTDMEDESGGAWRYIEGLRRRMVAAQTVRAVTATAAVGVRHAEESEARRKAREGSPPRPRVAKPSTSRDESGHSCPVHWFVADDARSGIRYFSLQGSDSIDSWRTNLSFDPVPFEDPACGVQVHRGIYGAALALYPRFAPMVTEHLATSPFARISMTGHSLGGSIAKVLALMLVSRGVLRPSQLGPIYTFGAAACFCEATVVERAVAGRSPRRSTRAGDEMDVAGATVDSDDVPTSSGGVPSFRGLGARRGAEASVEDGSVPDVLRRLGVPKDTVRNVIMTHDIVPRAFGCDYKPVAAMLRSIFSNHTGLAIDSRSIMYHFVGRVVLLQPSDDIAWVRPDEATYPLLPRGAGLYELIEPDVISRTRSLALASLDALDTFLADDTARGAAASTGFMPASRAAHQRPAPRRASASAALEGYPAASSPPVAAAAALHRHAYHQSLRKHVDRVITSFSDRMSGPRDAPDAHSPALHVSHHPLTTDMDGALGSHVESILVDAVPLKPCSDYPSSSSSSSSTSHASQGSQVCQCSNSDADNGAGCDDSSFGRMHASVDEGDEGATPPPLQSLHDAQMAVLDTPHPLAVLSSASAYGDDGLISRFHNPDHYTQALGSVVRSNLAPLRRAAASVDLGHIASVLKARLRRAVAAFDADLLPADHAAVAAGNGSDVAEQAPACASASRRRARAELEHRRQVWRTAVWDLEAASTVRESAFMHLSPNSKVIFGGGHRYRAPLTANGGSTGKPDNGGA